MLEITTEICQENGLNVDKNSFLKIMEEQKTSSKNSKDKSSKNLSQKLYSSLELKPTEFTGYESLESNSLVMAVIKDNKSVKKVNEGDEVDLILDKTPFYAERGGQMGDTGIISFKEGEIEVLDTITPYGNIYVHKGRIKKGNINVGTNVNPVVDFYRRENLRRNHTATHLVHAALREIIGSHVRQSGSLVHPDYLRFDFTSLEGLSDEVIKEVENRVNLSIRKNLEVQVHYTTYNKAIDEGALAFFDEKYDHEVRTIKIDAPWSYELCGGTHMDSTGGIGLFKIISENGIGSGNRRLFATTGIGTEDLVYEKINTINSISKKLNSNVENVYDKFISLLDQNKEQQKTIENLQQQLTDLSMGNSKSETSEFILKNTKFSCTKAIATNIGSLRKAGDSQRTKLESGIAIVGSVVEEKGVIVIMATDDTEFQANEVAKIIAKEVNGGGGGNKFSAQVGIKDIKDYERFFSNSKNILENNLIK